MQAKYCKSAIILDEPQTKSKSRFLMTWVVRGKKKSADDWSATSWRKKKGGQRSGVGLQTWITNYEFVFPDDCEF